jgi:hypothetical protein
MSLDLGQMIAGATSIVQAQRNMRAWVQLSRLGDKWETVEFKRDGAHLASQTVRIEFDNTFPTEADSDSGVGFSHRGILFGIKDHPTLADLDVDVWDTFVLYDQEFTIMSVNKTLFGQIQCWFESMGS